MCGDDWRNRDTDSLLRKQRKKRINPWIGFLEYAVESGKNGCGENQFLQGGRHTTGSAYFSLPVAFPSAILSTVALGENNCLTEFVKLIGYNRTSIALQSISREGGDCGARPIQWIAVGY